MIKKGIVVFGFLYLVSCIQSKSELAENDLVIGYNEPSLDSISLESVEPSYPNSIYQEWFEKGLFDSIVYDYENKNQAKEKNELVDCEIGFYNIAKIERTENFNIEQCLNRFPKSGIWKKGNDEKIYYSEELLQEIGSVETYSLMIVDFYKFQSYDLRYQKLRHSFLTKMNEKSDIQNLFYEIDKQTYKKEFNLETDKFLDSLSCIYKNWSFLQFLNDHYGSAFNHEKNIPIIDVFNKN